MAHSIIIIDIIINVMVIVIDVIIIITINVAKFFFSVLQTLN